ncbi:MAG TPA: hypothetical protein PLL25_06150 [Flavobacteriales bacterium]|jgi:hypothetical protein|nr:hypothetical protein [Flavobacteriales bacterium]HOZ40369.1 hypothetical protein [Flavobacteriales bacterium]
MNTLHRTRLFPLLPMVLFILSLALALVSCQRDDAVSPSSSSSGQVDDHGGHGNDDPIGDDNGGGN